MPSLIPDDIDDPSAERYRSQLDALGQDTRFISNRQIVKQLGDSIINSGRTNDDISATYGEGFLTKYLDEKNKPVEGQGLLGDAYASLRRQAIGLGEIGLSGVGLAADTLGIDSLRDAAMNKAAELQRTSAEGPQPTIDSYADVRLSNPMEIARYGANLIGGALPSVAESALTFGAGGVVGLAGKGILKKRLRSVLKDYSEEQIAKLATKKAFSTGAAAGLGASSLLNGPGEVYSQLYEYTKLDPSHEDYMDPDEVRKVSYAGGLMVAGLDFVSAGRALNKLLKIGDKQSSEYLKRLLGNLPEGVVLEGATEAAQEVIIKASEKYMKGEEGFTDAEIEEFINAGIMGAVGGSQFAAIASLRGPATPPREREDKPTLDVPDRPDTDEILRSEATIDSYTFKVGDEVSEAYGISGTIESISGNMATIRSEKKDRDGQDIVTTKQVPISRLAPIVEKPEKPTAEPESQTAKPKSISREKLISEIQKQSKPAPALGKSTFNVPKDEYSSKLNTQKQDKLTDQDKDNATSLYESLRQVFSNKDIQIKRGGTAGLGAKKFLELVKPHISEDVYNKAKSNNYRALDILRDSGLLGQQFNWQSNTAYDNELARQRQEKKDNLDMSRRQKVMENWSDGDILKSKDTADENFYRIESKGEGSIRVTKLPELTSDTGEVIDEADPRSYRRPVGLNKTVTTEGDTDSPLTEFYKIEAKDEIPSDIDLSKGLVFNLYTATGKPAKNGKISTPPLDSIGDVGRVVTSEPGLLKRLSNSLVNVGYTTKSGTEGVLSFDIDSELEYIEIATEVISLRRKIPLEHFEVHGSKELNQLPDDMIIEDTYFDEGLEEYIDGKQFKANIATATDLNVYGFKFGGRTSGVNHAVFRRRQAGEFDAGTIRVVSMKQNDQRVSAFDSLTGKFESFDKWIGEDEGAYDFVGFITTKSYKNKKVDLYFDSAEKLRADLSFGGYVEPKLSDDNLPVSISVGEPKLLQKKLRQALRPYDAMGESVTFVPDEESGKYFAFVGGKKEESLSSLYAQLLKEQSQQRGQTFDDDSDRKTNLRDLNPDRAYSQLSEMSRRGFDGFERLMGVVGKYRRFQGIYNKLRKYYDVAGRGYSRPEAFLADVSPESELVELDKFELTDKDIKFFSDERDRFGAVSLTLSGYVDKYFNETRKFRKFKDILSRIVSNPEKIDVKSISRRRGAEPSLLESLYERYLFNQEVYKTKFSDKALQEQAKTDPNKLAQLIKAAFIDQDMTADQAGFLMEASHGVATLSRDAEAYLRNKGREARTKEFDINDPKEIFKGLDLKESSVGEKAVNTGDTLIKRNEQIDRAFAKVEEVVPNYKIILLEYFGLANPNEQANPTISDDAVRDLNDRVAPENGDALSRRQATIPNFVDPTTGKKEPVRKIPETKEEIEYDDALSRESEVALVAPEVNPLIAKGHIDLVEMAKSAIQQFVGSGNQEESFNGNLVLKKIINNIDSSYINGEALSFWSTMLRGNNSIKDLRVRFMPYEQFREYARVDRYGVTAGVYNPAKNEVIISETFYNDPRKKVSPQEALASLIVHEITHAPVRLSMEVGYAYDKNDQKAIDDLKDLGIEVNGEALAKIYRNIKDVVLPYLKEVNKEFGVNPREYALSSVEEFFAELPSNYELRHLLKKARITPELRKKLNLKPDSLIKTLWQYIRRIISRIVGVEENLLQEADRYLKQVIKQAQPLGSYMGRLPFDLETRKQQMLFDFDTNAIDAPSDSPTFWSMFKIDKSAPDSKLYPAVADAVISPGNEDMDGQIAYDFAKRLGLNAGRLRKEMERAHKRYWASVRSKYRYSQVEIPNTEISLEVLRDYRSEIIDEYTDNFDVEFMDVSEVVFDENNEAGIPRRLRNLLRALAREDYFGFDLPSQAVDALFDPDFLQYFEVAPETKRAITEYANKLLKPKAPKLILRREPRKPKEDKIDRPKLARDHWLEKAIHVTYEDNLDSIRANGLTPKPSKAALDMLVRMYGTSDPDEISDGALNFKERLKKSLQDSSALHFLNPHDLSEWQGEHRKNIEFVVSQTAGEGLAPSDLSVDETLENVRRKKVILGFDPELVASDQDENMADYFPYNPELARKTNQAIKASDISVWSGTKWLPINDMRYSQVSIPPADDPTNAASGVMPNSSPDEAARVNHKATVAAYNDLYLEYVKIFTALASSNSLPDQYKGDDGLTKFIDKYTASKGSNISKMHEAYAEILGMEKEEVMDIGIGDQGMNRRARDRAMLDAVELFSKKREAARKRAADLDDKVERAKETIAAFDRMYARAKAGKLESVSDMADALKDKMLNMTLPQLQDLFSKMKVEDAESITVEDLNNFRERSDLKSKVQGAMEAIISMPDSVETSTQRDIVKAIDNSSDSRLEWLRENKIAKYIFANKTIKSADIYMLARVAKDPSDHKATMLKDIASIAAATTKRDAKKAFDDAKSKGRISTHLNRLKNLKIEVLSIDADMENLLSEIKINETINGEMMARELKLRTALGELEPVDIRQGVKLKVMRKRRDEDGNIITTGSLADKWELDEFTVKYSGGKLAHRDQFVKAHTETMEFLRDEDARAAYAQEPWFDLMREQASRAMHEPTGDQYFTIRKQAWMAGIESLNARANRLGYEGKKLAGMLARTSALFRDINSDSQYYAKRWNVAYLNLMDKLAMDGKNMFKTFYQDVWWWMDNHPEFDGNEEEAIASLWTDLKKKGNVPDKSKLNSETRKALVSLVRRTVEARDFEAEYNFNILGNRIRDDFKVQSLINGEMVDFYRRPVELGYATIPRVLNDSAVAESMMFLKKKPPESDINYTGEWVPDKSSEIKGSVYGNLRELNENGMLDEDVMLSEMPKLFTEDAVNRWAANYLKSDSRRSIFFGPDGMEMGNSYMNAVWEKASSDKSGFAALQSFMDMVYNDYVSSDKLLGKDGEISTERYEWYFKVTQQFQKHFTKLHSAYNEIIRQQDGGVQNMLMNSPRSLDSRQLASVLPKEYFYYDSYDEVTSAVRLQMMIATSVFGRGGSNANALRARAMGKYTNDFNNFKSVISEATGTQVQGIQSDYSKDVRELAYAVLRKRPELTDGKSAEVAFENLFAGAAAYGEMDIIFEHLNKYYGSGNVAGPFRDANVPLELLGLQSLSVLNNPKSSFWQGLSLVEFPMAFHGMNGMSLKATGKAFATFIDQTFGGVLEAMGVNIGHTHRYADYLANTHFRNSEADLTYKEYTAQVGTGGELTGFGMNSQTAKKGIRFMKKMAMHNRKDRKKGSRAPVDWTTPLIGMFPYLNSNINHGAGVGAIFAVEGEVLRIAKVIESQGLQNYHNFTAEELGLGNGTLEFFMGEKDGYNQMNNLLESVGLPNLSRLAFDFVQRKQQDPNTPVIERNTGLLINQIAMNEVTGEGFNAKSAVLYTNPFWKYAGIFLGWPLWKMARDNRVLQGQSNYVFGKDARTDRATWMAFLKYLSMVSAVYAPAGLAFAMLVDWYDDEVLEKPNNLPPVSPWALLPVIGPGVAYMEDPNFTLYSITSRLAKAGVPYGLGIDLANSVFSKGDPYGSSKEFSLDSRIFAWSMIKNVYDAMGNWMHQGEIDYQNVTRPILYGLGGNSAIQFIDAATAMLDIDSEERRVADYIGSRNIIKKYAWGMGLDLRPPAKGYGRPTPMSINVRQMERAAYNYDTAGFRVAYQDALEAAREAGEQNPEKAIRDKFARRLILNNITDGKITDEQLKRMLELMDEDERTLIERYIAAHKQFLMMIETAKPTTKIGRSADLFAQGYSPTRVPYKRTDPRLFALGYY